MRLRTTKAIVPMYTFALYLPKADVELLKARAKENNMSCGNYAMLCVKACDEAMRDNKGIGLRK